ncbi:MAG: hypothetical protein C7B46_18180 [Sulfobacillus benefaciens]|uniref:Uncharacterized protein n=1 Tax=Sulfobacillus benefaciens TaxID=453960 RepID=A0A2T2X6M8_9FIRM|nr:MAG: hypothetical protein C7B46_18180 [Sulfobacillus benefaciens]
MSCERLTSIISAPCIEPPHHTFFVRLHHRSYRPDGFPFRFPAEDRLVAVQAPTADSALAVARYHYFLYGADFTLEARTPIVFDRVNRSVTFPDLPGLPDLPDIVSSS